MDKEKSDYTSIIKANSLFGGVQLFNIMVAILKSKAIALFLGPVGFGISSLFISTIDFVSGLTNFGISTSAVKNISAASGSKNENKISKVIKVFRLLVWFTGLLGMILTILFSEFLSEKIFDDDSKSTAIIWISSSILFQQLCSGQLAVLQGLRRLKYLALANLIGNFFGLIFSIPFYYFYKLDGIVPSIIASSLATLIVSWYFSNKINIKNIDINLSTIFDEGGEMLRMGFAISMSSTIAMGSALLIRIFIGNIGSIAQVGLFTAGFAIINSYVSLIFRAMATDFFPRLSAISNNITKSHNIVNQQAEISLIILGPILAFFLIFVKWFIWLLYSDKFLGIDVMLYWATLGMYFKAASWAVAYIMLAQGNSRLFFWNELIANFYILILNLLGYWIYGLEGLGISFLFGYFLYCIQILAVNRFKYSFEFDYEFKKIFVIQFIMGIACFITTYIFSKSDFLYPLGIILILISCTYSFFALDKRISIKSLLNSYRKK